MIADTRILSSLLYIRGTCGSTPDIQVAGKAKEALHLFESIYSGNKY